MDKRQYLIIPTGGLCNRLRVVASCLERIDKNKNNIRIIWHKNNECYCDFSDLFQSLDGISTQDSKRFIYKKPSKMNLYLPYLINLLNPFSKYLYELSFVWNGTVFNELLYFLNKKISSFRWKNYDISKLLTCKSKIIITTCQPICENYSLSCFSPSEKVLQLITQIKQQYFKEQCVIGVHIRRSDNTNSSMISSNEKFIKKMNRELTINPNSVFYLTTDDNQVKSDFKNIFHDKVFSLDVPLSRKSNEGMLFAAVEFYLLSMTQKILGSYYSSFSIEAARLGNIPLEIIQ